ncbi:putative Ig domain-containing protein [Staphylococcus condimenti]|uniref:putative Ig domain-containing protein n=1 Tax=Staphylococcus condimenti TaxID=70255 RepID=UPI0011A0846D|nr:putative Ig domain-containing protein [Staphylococcus condimenti]
MRNNSHSRGFDARRQNKYSIRRFTVGTASIIVGATLLFGLGNEAKAAESEAPSTQETGNTTGQSGETPAAGEGSLEAPAADQTIDKTASGTEDVAVAAPAETPAPDVKAEQPVKAQETNAEQPPAATEVKPEAPKVQDAPVIEQPQNVEAPKVQDAPVIEKSQNVEAPQAEQVQAPKGEATQAPVQTEQQKTPAQADTATDNSKPVQADAPTSSVQDSSAKPAADNSTVVEEKGTTETPNKGTQATDNQQVPTEKGSTSLSADQKPQTTTAESGTATPLKQQLNNDSVTTNDTTSGAQNQKLTAVDQPAATGKVAAAPVNGQALANDGQIDSAKVDVSDPAVYKAIQESSQQKDASTIQATAESAPATRQLTFNSFAVAPSSTKQVAQNNVSAPQTNTLALAKAFAAAPPSVKEELEASAIYSPGTWMQTYGYQGNAVVMREGSKYNNTSNQEPIAGVKVYLQWTDKTGYVSPVYYTISGEDGRYVFDLSKAQTDASGKQHTFNLAADPQIALRTWAESPDPTLNVVKEGDSIRGFHNRLQRVNESWDFTAGINRVVTSQVILEEKPLQNDWLIKPEAQWETSGTSDGIWANTGDYGKVSGSVWYDLTAPYGSDARWIMKDTSDVNATGVKVVASYVNDQVAILFDNWKKANPNATIEDFRSAQQQIVNDYQATNGVGSHIAESVVGTVDKNGDYYIPFRGLYGISPYQQYSGAPISKTISDAEFGTLVKDADISHSNLMAWNGTIGQKHRHINSDYMYIVPIIENTPTFSNNYYNNMFTTADVSRDINDAKMLSSYNGSSQDFAFVTTNPMHDISVEGSDAEVAKPGDVLVSKTDGLFPGTEYQIQWFKDGVAVGSPVTVTAAADGTVKSVPLTVPTDLNTKAIYTSGVFSQGVSTTSTGTALALDSISAEPFVIADLNEPEYKDGAGLPGSTVEIGAPTFTNPTTGESVEVPENTKFEAGDNAPEDVTVNPNGSLSVVVPEGAAPGDVITVPVKVTYPDGSTDTVDVHVTVSTPQTDLNEPEYKDGAGLPGSTVEIGAPTFTNPTTGESVEVPENTKFEAGDNAPEGVTVNPNGSLSVVVPEGATPGDVITVPVKVTYPDGSTDTVDVHVTVSTPDTTPPTIQPIDDVTVPEDQAITPIPVVTDDENATVDVKDLPDGVIYNPETGQIEGTPSTPGEYQVTVTVTDEAGNQTSEDFTITVTDATAPVIEPIADNSSLQGAEIDPIPVVVDDLEATVDVTGLPEGLVYNPDTKQIEGTATVPGTYEVTVTATDKAGNSSEETFTYTVVDTTPPIVEPIDDVTVPEDQEITPIPVKYTDDSKSEVLVEGLPEGLSYNPTTGQIEGTPATPGEYPITVTVKDEKGNSQEVKFTITVEDTTPPVVNPIDDVTVPEDQAIIPIPVVTDDETATVDVEGLPEGVTYNPETGQIEGTPTTPGTYPVTVTVTDEAGNQTSEDFTITVKDTTPPVVNPIDDVKVPEDQPIIPIPVVTDDKTATVDVTGLPEGVTYNPETGQIEGTPTTPGEYPVTVTVTDEAGNKTEEHFTITVEDKTAPDAPVINPVNEGDKTVSGTGEPNGTVKVTFPDGSTSTGKVDEDGNWTVNVPEGTELKPGDKVTATVTDEAGNVSEEATVTVTEKDTVAPDKPVINPVDEGDKTVSGTGEPNGTVTVTFPDGSTSTGKVDEDGNWTVNVPEGTELNPGDKVTATVTDEAGNVSEEATVTVTGKDTVAPDKPVINPVDEGDKTVSGTGEPNGTVTVTFPDGSTSTGKVDEDGNWTVNVPEGTTVKKGDKITATITDEAGNVSEEATVTVTGEEPNQGTDGDKGDTGNNGDNTTPGNNTTPGDNGETSEPGTNGSVDNNGNQGNTGSTGDNSEAPAPSNQGTDNNTATDNASELPNTAVGTDDNANNGQVAVPGMEASDNGQVVTENGVPAEAANNSEAPAEQAKGDKELPETGTNNTGSATLFGGLFAALGSILLFRKRRQEKKDN